MDNATLQSILVTLKAGPMGSSAENNAQLAIIALLIECRDLLQQLVDQGEA